MDNECYRFKVGDFSCFAVNDGSYTYTTPQFPPPEVILFSNASPESLTSVRRRYKLPTRWKKWTSPYICLVVKTDKYLVLVDAYPMHEATPGMVKSSVKETAFYGDWIESKMTGMDEL